MVVLNHRRGFAALVSGLVATTRLRVNLSRQTPILLLMLGALWLSVAGAQSLTLNLKDADINALIGTISEITGKNFIIDPRVKGKVTVVSSKPMNVDEAYQVFLSILKVHGFAAVPSGNIIKIVPDVNAKQDTIPLVSDKNPGSGDAMVTRVVQVDNVAAAQLVPILRPLIPQQGHLAAYAGSNVLILSDRASNIERIVKIIRRIDTAGDTSIEVIPLRNASATEMVRILTTLHGAAAAGAKGQPVTQKVTLAADERTNSVLMAGDRSTRMRMRVTIELLDTAGEEDSGNTHVVYLKYAKAEDMVPVLTGLSKTRQAGVARGKVGAKGAAGALREGVDFNIQADVATNALVITAQPDMYQTLQSVIRKLDIRRAQVLIEAIIAEVSPNKNKALGVQWRQTTNNFDRSGTIGGTNFSNAGSNINAVGQDISAVGGGLNIGFFDGTVTLPGTDTEILNIGFLLTALQGDSLTNVLATPNLLTLDNEEAEIIVANNVPFITGSFTSTEGGATDPFQTIERQDVGLILKVTPQINEGDAVQLEISQEISNIVPSPPGASDLTTAKRSIETNVLIDDGRILILGGLIRDDVREEVESIPILGDIPFLGALFRSTSSSIETTNLMVFLQPSIVREGNEGYLLTNAKYNMIRARQLAHQERGIKLYPEESPHILPEITAAQLAPLPGQESARDSVVNDSIE